jgi:hypothetical protein
MAIGLQLFALAAGNAVRIVVTPPATAAAWWRVLRRTSDSFTGAGDTGAVLVADDCTDNCLIDVDALVNGTSYFYHVYFTPDGETWTDAPSVSIVPAATYQDAAPDPQLLLVQRLTAGMAVEIASGRFTPSSGTCPVVTSPYALADRISFPMISVHLDTTGPETRAIGETVTGDILDVFGTPGESEGWLASFSMNVVGVSLNPDERIALRMAVRRVIQVNLEVFDAAGMLNIGFQQQDSEDFEAKNAPLFMTGGKFTCQAPASVIYGLPIVTSTTETATIGSDLVYG